MQPNILIVDDDPHICEVIGFALDKAGYHTSFAENGLAALATYAAKPADLIVLDIGLPEMDGLEVCRTLRASSDVPILFLTARDDEIDRIIGLEIGGDDYVTKPFSPRELVARIKAILKRGQAQVIAAKSVYQNGDLLLDPTRHICQFAGQGISLTKSEFMLLSTLIAKPDIIFRRQVLIDALYGHNIHVSDRTIDSHIRNIRSKLKEAGCEAGIVTVHGVGLRMGPCRAT